MTARYTIAGALIGVLAAYLLSAFVVWDFNPEHWVLGERLGCATFMALAGGALALIGFFLGESR